MSPSLSIIIPAYNEQNCLGGSLVQVLGYAAACPGGAEVLVVDDGSTDATARIVEDMAAGNARGNVPLRLVRHSVNRGKGASIRSGFAQARGGIVLFTDADLSAPIAEADRLLEPIHAGRCDIAIGSRAVDPSLIEVHQSPLRRRGGRIFNAVVRALTGLDIADTQCGFKAFRRLPMEPVFRLQRVEGFAFDVELLYIASRRGLRIVELPVRWSHVHDSRVSLLTDSTKMFVDLCRIRWNDWRGRYRSAPEA